MDRERTTSRLQWAHTSTPIVISGLDLGTTYYFTIYSYRNCPGGTIYELSGGLLTNAITIPNSAPSFSLPASPNRTVPNDAAQVVSSFASAITDNDGGVQNLSFSLTTDNDGLFSVLPAIDEVSGDLTFTPFQYHLWYGQSYGHPYGRWWRHRAGEDTSPTQEFDIFTTPAGLVINEIDPNDPGADDNEFVELYSEFGASASSDNLTIVFFNGNDDLSFQAIDLDGFAFDAEGYLLVGNPLVPGTVTTFPDARLQNGVDAVALYIGDFSGNDVEPTLDGLVDVIVYSIGPDGRDGLGLDLWWAYLPGG